MLTQYKGRTIRYLRGGEGEGGQIPKKNSRTQKKYRAQQTY